MPLCGGGLKTGTTRFLLRIQFDDQLFVDRRRLHVFALGQSHDLGLELLAILLEHGTEFWLCATLRASSTMAFWCILSLIATSSPTLT